MEFIVKFTWYDDERIWVAQSSNAEFAITTDHVSFDALLEREKWFLRILRKLNLNTKAISS